MKFRLDMPIPEVLDSVEEIQALIKDMENSPGPFAYDTETSGLEWDAVCYMITIAYRSPRLGGRRVLIPTIEGRQLKYFPLLKPWFENPNKKLIAHNAAYDYRILRNHGIDAQGLHADTLKMIHVWDEEAPKSLKEASQQFLGLGLREFKEIFGKKIQRTTVAEVFNDPLRRSQATEYATLDAWATLELYDNLKFQLEHEPWNAPDSLGVANPNLWEMHQVLDIPFLNTLQRMTQHGVLIDREYLSNLEEPMRKQTEKITEKVCRECGMIVNLNSPKQLADLFFKVMKLRPRKMSKSGPSTDKDVMEELAAKEGISTAHDVLEFRDIMKTWKTYVVGLQKFIARDHRIHTSVAPTTVTNRLRSSDPNLMNLPRAGSDEFTIRKAIIAPPGQVLLCADYSGLEMCLAAAMLGDDQMIKELFAGIDPHTTTAARMFNADYDKIMAAKKKKKDRTVLEQELVNQRDAAKTIGFGINYGIAKYALAIKLTKILERMVSPDEAEGMINRYFQARPGIYAGRERLRKEVHEMGMVSSLLGRLRRPKAIYYNSYAERGAAERQSGNFPIQGTAADLIQLAMIQIDKDPELKALNVIMILQIHDELLAECPFENKERGLARMIEIMENPEGWPGLTQNLPTKVEGGWGYNWAEAK